jgi:mRNA interferase MazF
MKIVVGIHFYNRMYKQGDVVIVKFPFTDGSEFKRRPALVISNELVNKTGDYLIVQITSKINNDGLSVSIENNDFLLNLPLKSFIRTHKIFTVNESLVLSKITTANPNFLKIISLKIAKLIAVQ